MAVVFTCSIDDGHPSDLRMADLLNKHGLNGTFFVPINNCEGYDVMSPAQVREVGRRFEIGSHTFDHRVLNQVDKSEAKYQIIEGNKRLEDVLGKKVNGFCYPGGKYRQRDAEIVRSSGFSYARTTVNLCFDAGDDPFQMPTTVQFYPHDRTLYFRNFASAGKWGKRYDGLLLAVQHQHWIERLHALFDHACANGKPFHLWGHSWEIDKLNAWRELDGFFAYVASKVPVQDRLNNEQLAARAFHA